MSHRLLVLLHNILQSLLLQPSKSSKILSFYRECSSLSSSTVQTKRKLLLRVPNKQYLVLSLRGIESWTSWFKNKKNLTCSTKKNAVVPRLNNEGNDSVSKISESILLQFTAFLDCTNGRAHSFSFLYQFKTVYCFWE